MHSLKLSSWQSIYFLAALISIILSVWVNAKASVVNPDAICYLQSAETMRVGLNAGMSVCDQAKWPFYSAIIYGLVSVANISSFQAAIFLNSLFSLISVIAFISIVGTLKKDSTRILWLGAFVILMAHEFNAVRPYIIRDHGFWAFYLLSFLFFLKYFQHGRFSNALLWSGSLIVATLFRIEGAIFLIALPFAFWFDSRKNFLARAKAFLQLNSLLLVLGILLFIIFSSHHSFRAGRLSELKFQLIYGVAYAVQNFYNKIGELRLHIINPDGAGDAPVVLFLMLLSWYLWSISANVTFIYAALVIYAWYKKVISTDRFVLWSYVLVNVMVTSIFFVQNFFLSKRYLIALSLILMLWIPFALEELIKQRRKLLLTFVMFLIIVSSVGGIFRFGYSKNYIHDAGAWLADNVFASATLYSNDYQVMYYSKHFGNDIFIKAPQFSDIKMITHGKWKQYDYLALRLDKNHLEIMKEIHLTPTKIFMNKRGDQVVIYHVPHDGVTS